MICSASCKSEVSTPRAKGLLSKSCSWPQLYPPPSHSPGGWDRLGLGHYSLHVLGEETEAQGGSGLQPCSRKGAEGPKASLGPSLGPSFCKHMLAGLPTGRQRRGTVAS